jgi:hypothetical protein
LVLSRGHLNKIERGRFSFLLLFAMIAIAFLLFIVLSEVATIKASLHWQIAHVELRQKGEYKCTKMKNFKT